MAVLVALLSNTIPGNQEARVSACNMACMHRRQWSVNSLPGINPLLRTEDPAKPSVRLWIPLITHWQGCQGGWVSMHGRLFQLAGGEEAESRTAASAVAP